MTKIRIIVATRMSHDQFMQHSATGISLRYTAYPGIELILTSDNKQGLPTIYNQAIEASKNDPAILVFVHDDVYFCDYYWIYRLLEGLTQFDIVGVVGNKVRIPGQVSWAFRNDKFDWDDRNNFSGMIGHGKGGIPEKLNRYGPPRQQVKILDGVFLAASSQKLIESGVRFDEQLDFHFYDMDFCRSAEVKGLNCGTWDIAMIHQSAGALGSQGWKSNSKRYFEKWGS